jgi:hypothetical protein
LFLDFMVQQKETLILFDNLEIDKEKLNKQVALIKERIAEKYRENLLEGVLAELASLQIAYQHLIVTMKKINSQLRMLDYPIQNLLSSNEQLGAREITIDAALNLMAEQGFYEVEYGQGGVPFRWTGPNNTFYFDLLLDRGEPKELILKLTSTLRDENIDNLRCLIDDQEILLNKERTRGLFYIKGIVPKRVSVGWTRISFVVPSPVKISEINPESPDGRSLGVAFSELTIKSLDLDQEAPGNFEIN